MESIGNMLQNKMSSDIDGVKRKYQVIHDQIDNAVAAEKYQDADVVQGVTKLDQAAKAFFSLMCSLTEPLKCRIELCPKKTHTHTQPRREGRQRPNGVQYRLTHFDEKGISEKTSKEDERRLRDALAF